MNNLDKVPMKSDSLGPDNMMKNYENSIILVIKYIINCLLFINFYIISFYLIF